MMDNHTPHAQRKRPREMKDDEQRPHVHHRPSDSPIPEPTENIARVRWSRDHKVGK